MLIVACFIGSIISSVVVHPTVGPLAIAAGLSFLCCRAMVDIKKESKGKKIEINPSLVAILISIVALLILSAALLNEN